MSTNKKPDFNVTCYNKETGESGTVGAAWNNDDGSISMKLIPFVRLEQKDGFTFRLFPTNKDITKYTKVTTKPKSSKLNSEEDDTPF